MKYTWLFGAIGILLFGSLATLAQFGGEGGWFANNQMFLHQLLYIGIGVLLVRLIRSRDPRYLSESSLLAILYVIGLFVLLAVVIFGREINGARSWFDLGIVSLQPADFVKIILILVLAKYLSKRRIALAQTKHFFISALYCMVPVALIMLQPDFGTAVVFCSIWFFMLLIAGVSRKFVIALMVAAVAIGSIGWVTVLKSYQKDRIISFVQPLADKTGSGYNAYQSVVAVGSGGVSGRGVGFGTQSRLEYLPEHHTDFIFASFSEEWGYVGSLIVVGAMLVIILQLLWFARYARTNFESLTIIGYASFLATHFIIHIGMNIGMLPVTGLPMPFMSYGGSHIVAELIGLGIVVAMTDRYLQGAHRGQHQAEFTSLTEM